MPKRKMTELEKIQNSDAWIYLKIIFPDRSIKYVPLKDEDPLEGAWLYAYFHQQVVEIWIRTGIKIGEVKRELVSEDRKLCYAIVYRLEKSRDPLRTEKYFILPGGNKIRWT